MINCATNSFGLEFYNIIRTIIYNISKKILLKDLKNILHLMKLINMIYFLNKIN